MSSDRELDALAGLDLGPDEGPNGVDGEEHHDSEDEAEEKVEAGVSQLSTDGLDAHIGDGSQLLEATDRTVFAAIAGLGPFTGRIDDGVLKVNVQLIQRNS